MKAPFKRGEIIQVADDGFFLHEGVYKVDDDFDNMLCLSVGRVELMVQKSLVVAVERGMPEPESWTALEVAFRRKMVERCDCRDCRQELVVREADLARERGCSVSMMV